jgi:peptidoglycan hydrolase-like protein with peptidoglycan-binding domain
MIKDYFLQEINLKKIVKVGSTGPDVQKIQEWINLWRYVKPEWKYIVTVDGEFGQQTDQVIRIFQQMNNLPIDGIVGVKTFQALVKPMINAFTRIDGTDLRTLIIAYAEQHLKNQPKELYNSNRGPWVRAYMDGHEGKEWAWCMGFVQTVLDQAFSTLGQSFTMSLPRTFSCDVAGEYGRQKNSLVPFATARPNPGFIRPGDIFLVNRTPHDWNHTGIVTGLAGTMIHTIEGNTNDEGSREGFEVCRRIRNLATQQLDIFKIN